MKFLGGLSGGGLGGAALGAAGAAVLAVGGYVGWSALQDDPAPEAPATPLVAVPQPSETAAPEVAETPPGDSAAPAAPATPAPVAPSFDLVRVEADGSAVIAGLAAPGARVQVLLDGVGLTSATADENGNFVALVQIGLSDMPRVVSLLAEDASGAQLASEESAIIQPVVQVASATAPAEAAAPVPATGAQEDAPAESAATPPAETPAETPATIVAETPAEAPAETPATIVAETPAETPATPEGEAPAETLAEIPATPAETTADTPVEAAEAAQQSTAAPQPTAAGAAETQAPAETPAGGQPATQPAIQPTAMAAEPAQPGQVAETAPLPASPAEPAPTPPPAPPRVMIASSEGITVVQGGGRGLAVQQSVSLDAITYDAAGEVQLSGRGGGGEGGAVRVYLDNRPILTTEITEDGQWRTNLPEVESGVYTLRVDQLRQDGTVASRIETPFQREDAEQLASVAAEVAASDTASAPRLRAITVQPDMTLWQIATDTYGEGNLYVRVFEANRDVIRDPDLIYPGQVFTLPE